MRTVNSDFDLNISIIPKSSKNFIEQLLENIEVPNLYDELKKLGWKPKYNKKGEIIPPKKPNLKVAIIEILQNKIYENKIAKDDSDTIYIYNGACWIAFNKESIIEMLYKFAIKLGLTTIEAKDERFLESLYKQLIVTLPTIKRTTNQNLINLQNGTFNLDTFELQQFNPDDFLTYQLPFCYNPYSKNELFLKFLDEIIPDKETQKTLQEILGSIFIKNIKLEYAFFFYGSGANGKSVIMEILKTLLGEENLSFFSIDELNQEYNRAELKDKLLNISSEAETKDIKSDLFKKLASGEPIIARHLYGKPFKIDNYAKFIFMVNRLHLKNIEYTTGFFRRFVIVPFSVTIPEEKRDKRLHQKIIDAGLDGIFHWMLEGAKRVMQEEDIFISKECKKAIREFIKNIDSVLQFLEENNLVHSEFNRYYLKELYLEYKTWAQESGIKPLGKKHFSQRLEMLEFKKGKDKSWYFLMETSY